MERKKMTIVIHKPLENIKIGDRHMKAVGIPDWRLRGEPAMVTVDVKYKYRAGSYKERQFPHLLQISKSEILKCRRKYSQAMRSYYYVVPVEIMTEVKPMEPQVIEKPREIQRNLL